MLQSNVEWWGVGTFLDELFDQLRLYPLAAASEATVHDKGGFQVDLFLSYMVP